MGEWLLVVGVTALLIAVLFMSTSVDIFLFRKAGQALRHREPIRWRDPETWRDSKQTSARWVLGIAGYIATGIGLSAIFPAATPVLPGLLIVVPLVVIAYRVLIRNQP